MTGAILLALMGMGVLASALFMTGENDPSSDPDAPPDTEQDDVMAEDVRQLNAFDTLLASDAPEVFAIDLQPEHGGGQSVVSGFDVQNDSLRINLDPLVSPEGQGAFAPGTALTYRLEIDADSTPGVTAVNLSVFDTEDADAEPVQYSVLLQGVTALPDDSVWVEASDTNLARIGGPDAPATVKGTAEADTLEMTQSTEILNAGQGDDTVTGVGAGAQVMAGFGSDMVDVTGQALQVFGNGGDDVITVRNSADPAAGSEIFGGDGNDTITLEIGSNASGGDGADELSISVTEPPLNAQPLFLWNQPVEDARFPAHSLIRLDDGDDTIRLNLSPDVPGHLHQVRLTQEVMGLNSQEVFTQEYSLIIWSPEGVTDIASLVRGDGSAFNSGLAKDAEQGAPEYESAATDPLAPRVLLTIDHGTAYSGDFNDVNGTVSGGYDNIHEVNLQINREITSVHRSMLY